MPAPANKVAESNNPTRLCIAANFTIEPIEQVLTNWLDQLGIAAEIQFAPYNQVFQQLLEGGLLRNNRDGINLVGLDLNGWLVDGPLEEARTQLENTITEFLAVLRSGGAQGVGGAVLVFPSGAGSGALAERHAAVDNARETILSGCSSIPGWSAFDLNKAAERYLVKDIHDPFSDKLGHIPYTEEMFAASATVAARWIRKVRTKPRKVIVLDCDNTLWQGICGEGAVQITPPYRKLHEFMLRQREEGVLLAIASKNNEADVMAVLDSPDCVLKPDHFTSWQINWQAKSEDLKTISEELGLALNSFLFLDDSPYECLEVRNACPDVLTLALPSAPEAIPSFLDHQWAFDRPAATEEDRSRASMYQAEKQRANLSRRALTREEFLASLQIQIQVARATETDLPRVAQLTQRTTQFNMTGVTHTVQTLSAGMSEHSECWTVRVQDVFGDYGLVGAIVFDTASDSLRVNTFLLSCRALGRGVEDRMMDDLKLWAVERGAESVVVPFVSTARNRPALEFLGRYCDAPLDAKEPFECVLSASSAASEWRPTAVAPAEPVDTGSKSNAAVASGTTEGDLLALIAQLQTSEAILKSVRARKSPRPDGAQDYVEPAEELEKKLARIWSDCLAVEPIGKLDGFLELGGTSLIAARILARIHSELEIELGIAEIFEHPTVQQLAAHISTVAVQAPGATAAFSTRASTSSAGSS